MGEIKCPGYNERFLGFKPLWSDLELQNIEGFLSNGKGAPPQSS